MLQQADVGILFRPPENVVRDFPQFPVVHQYDELKVILQSYFDGKPPSK